MQSHATGSLIIEKLEANPIFASLVLAFFLRALVLVLGFQDYWGDSYHNLIMSRLTLENDWVYSDFKDRHLSWLPAIRYWGAFVQWITGSYSIQVLNIANSVLGVATVGFGTYLTKILFDNKAALLAAVLLSIQPYLIVFSYMNMAEGLATLLVVLWFIGIHKKIHWLIISSAAIAVLTRTELMYLMGVSSIFLFLTNEKKRALWTIVGITIGLSIWSGWSYWNSGNPLSWIINRFSSTSTSTNFYTEDVNLLFRYGVLPFLAIIQVFPLIIFFIWIRKTSFQIKQYNLLLLIGFFVFNHLFFFMLAQTKIISYPETRHVVFSVPIATIWMIGLFGKGYFRPFVDQRKMILLLAISLIQLAVPFYRQYSIQPRKEIGFWIKENIDDESLIWSDLAVPIATSEKNPNQFISSNVLLDNQFNDYIDNENDLLELVKESKIEYLLSYYTIYSFPDQVLEELQNLEPFESNGIYFVPVYSYEPFAMQKASAHDYLRFKVESNTQVASVWRIYSE